MINLDSSEYVGITITRGKPAVFQSDSKDELLSLMKINDERGHSDDEWNGFYGWLRTKPGVACGTEYKMFKEYWPLHDQKFRVSTGNHIWR